MSSRTYSLCKSSDELKKLIAENPDLPICVLAGEEANGGDYSWMYCSDIQFSIGEILDTDFYEMDDEVITDRDNLEEIVENMLYDEYEDEEELNKAIKKKLEELEPYWKKVICIWATN